MSHLGPIWPNLEVKFDIPDESAETSAACRDGDLSLAATSQECQDLALNRVMLAPNGTNFEHIKISVHFGSSQPKCTKNGS